VAYHSDQLFALNGKCVVVIAEKDEETRRELHIEEHPRNYADGQRLRLGLPCLEERVGAASCR
jgi:hypothetical protein